MWVEWFRRIPWGSLAVIAAVAALLYWVWLLGYGKGMRDISRESDATISRMQSRFDEFRREEAEKQNEALRTVVARYNAQVAAAHQADADFQAKKQQLERENAELKKQIADVTRQWVDEKGKHHPIECVFTRGFVQQYNAALGVSDGDSGMSAATGSASAGNTTGATDTALARLRDSGVTQADVLANVTDNARQCRVWREQVNGLLDYTEGLHQ
ncbi:hypothetical protein EW514_15890 [Salmonella enterica subsp. enterica serovar Napoli]|uniref:hypothetical protein n=1 Tax=Salmonella enterica TaxID=28901 RepID=UPI00138015D8|nr:hypothetical protein [Salmonella enterica subsp. enterica serovar Napoli]